MPCSPVGIPTFRRNALPPSSEVRSEPNKNPEKIRQQAEGTLYFYLSPASYYFLVSLTL
jgi:hypothetical protein